jgi:uncharacterized protein (DUF1800 family)
MRGERGAEGGPATTTSTLSRRRFVRNAAVGGAIAGTGISSSLLQVLPAQAAERAGAASFLPSDNDLHLLRRATWGPTPNLHKQIRKMGMNKWLDQQLKPHSIDDRDCERIINKRFPRLAWNSRQAYGNLDGSWDLMYELGYAAVVRATWSKRQLFEVMVDFWSNHLNVANPSDNVWWSRHDYDRTVIRRHALGKFSDMLAASATHPAMMTYLNNAESTKDNPNENYGRELLELHTVGVDGGYTEAQMRTSALILTGLGVHSYDDVNDGTFRYNPDNHYTGHVKVLNWSSRNDSARKGLHVALDYVDYLAHAKPTARRIASKLCERFLSDKPPGGLVDKMADTYRAHDTAIVPVLHVLFGSKAFRQSKGDKVIRPMQDVVATLRILGVKPDADNGTDGLRSLYWTTESLSDAPLAWVQPNGYPDYADAWRSAGGTLNRWNTHLSLAAGWNDHLQLPDLRRNLLPARLPKNHGDLMQALAQRLVFRKLSAPHRNALCTFVGRMAADPITATDAAVTWRLPYLVALILDSPYHEIR